MHYNKYTVDVKCELSIRKQYIRINIEKLLKLKQVYSKLCKAYLDMLSTSITVRHLKYWRSTALYLISATAPGSFCRFSI